MVPLISPQRGLSGRCVGLVYMGVHVLGKSFVDKKLQSDVSDV